MDMKENPHIKFALLELDSPQRIASETGIVRSQYLLDMDNPPSTPPKQGNKYFANLRSRNICNKLYLKFFYELI